MCSFILWFETVQNLPVRSLSVLSPSSSDLKWLVTGASGGGDLAALLLGKAFGSVVVAAASSAEKAEAARALGADQAFVYPAEGAYKASLTKLFKEQAGDRLFDVVCDPVEIGRAHV